MSASISQSINSVAAPRCYVDIYPNEGGFYTLTGGSAALISCVVSKSIRDTNPGNFALELAPGGPYGPNARPSWLDIITPMSLCVIGMQRGTHKQIVMVGVVLSITEPQQFAPMQPVRRIISIQGMDFQYFFSQRSFYALSFLYSSPSAGLGARGQLAGLSDSLLTGTPDSVGAKWFDKVMAGTEGVLANTNFAYGQFDDSRGGAPTRPTFSDLMAKLFQPYPPQAGLDLTIPMGDFFMVTEESWIAKFLKIFPFPWYEFFVITAPIGSYGATQANKTIDMAGFAPVSPTVVARVNPLPFTFLDSSNKLQMDTTLWDALPWFTFDIGGPFARDINFNDSEVRNFYVINPLWTPFTPGNNNHGLVPFTYNYVSWVNPTSIQRYGYRPQISEIHWFSDISGQIAQMGAEKGWTEAQYEAFLGNIALKQTSYFEPSPLMAGATCSMSLRPDIMPGCKFLFAPFKDNVQWTFYIDAVSHSYQFGQQAGTTLRLSRGLPSYVYADPALMLNIHSGRAMRIDGVYASGLPQGASPLGGLQPFNFDSMKNLLGEIAGQVFAVPGAQ